MVTSGAPSFCGQKGEEREGSLEIPVRFSTRPETNEIEEMMNRSHDFQIILKKGSCANEWNQPTWNGQFAMHWSWMCLKSLMAAALVVDNKIALELKQNKAIKIRSAMLMKHDTCLLLTLQSISILRWFPKFNLKTKISIWLVKASGGSCWNNPCNNNAHHQKKKRIQNKE